MTLKNVYVFIIKSRYYKRMKKTKQDYENRKPIII